MILSALLIPAMPLMLLALGYAQLKVALRDSVDTQRPELQPA
jgi:hypothetical protein